MWPNSMPYVWVRFILPNIRPGRESPVISARSARILLRYQVVQEEDKTNRGLSLSILMLMIELHKLPHHVLVEGLSPFTPELCILLPET